MRTVGFGMGDGQAVRLGQGVMWEEEKECTEGDGGNGGHGFPVDREMVLRGIVTCMRQYSNFLIIHRSQCWYSTHTVHS